MVQRLRGRTIIDQPVATAEIANDSVTYAKIQNVSATDRLLGRKTAAAGDVEEITVAGDITQSGSTFSIGADKVTRAMHLENALDVFGIPLADVRTDAGAVLGVAEAAGTFYADIGTNQLYIRGEEALSETEVSVGWFEVYLPPNYVAAGDVTIRAVVDVTGAGTLGTCTIDFEARESDDDGAIGADLVTTAATAVSATAGAKDFVVTATGLVAGDKLVVKMTTSINESAGTAIRALITKLALLCDVK